MTPRIRLSRWLLVLVAGLVTACAPAVPPAAIAEPTARALGGSTNAPGSFAPAAPASSGPTAAPRATARPTPAPPEPAVVRRRLERSLQAALDDARAGASIPGISATVIFPDGTSWTGASGLADVAASTPVTPDTAFAIASISKTFLAALTLELAAEGVIRLDDPVGPYLPALKLPAGVTIRMLLDHTSGLHDYFLNPKIDRALQSDPSRAWATAEVMRYVGKPYFPPGTGWRYSNTNYFVLGLLVESVTQRSISEELRTRFFEPLDLDTTWYQVAEEPREDLAHGYRMSGASEAPRLTDLSDGTSTAPFRSVLTAAGGAGSIAAGSLDVAVWARALYGGAAIEPKSLALMLSGIDVVAGLRPRIPYGLGVQAVPIDGHRAYGHSGRLLGFRSLMRWLPDEQIAIAVLTNQSRHDPAAVAVRLLKLVLPEPRPCPCALTR